MVDRLHKERFDFTRSQSNAQLCICASFSSDRAFTNLLRKVEEAAKCLVKRNSKIAAAVARTVSNAKAEAANAATVAAAVAPTQSPSDTVMAEAENAESCSKTLDRLMIDVLFGDYAAASHVDSASAYVHNGDAKDPDREIDENDDSEAFCIAAAISAADDTTLKMTRLPRRLTTALFNDLA